MSTEKTAGFLFAIIDSTAFKRFHLANYIMTPIPLHVGGESHRSLWSPSREKLPATAKSIFFNSEATVTAGAAPAKMSKPPIYVRNYNHTLRLTSLIGTCSPNTSRSNHIHVHFKQWHISSGCDQVSLIITYDF